MSQPLIPVAKAILYQEDQLLLQLRDDKPDIYSPNQWGLFGGMMEPGETPEQALVREIDEELCWVPTEITYLFSWEESDIRSCINLFAVPLTVGIEQLTLTEGQAMRLFNLSELTDYPVVPKILQILPKVTDMLPSSKIAKAWQRL